MRPATGRPGRPLHRRRLVLVAVLVVVVLAPRAGADPPPSAPILRVNRIDVRRSPAIDLVVTPPRELSLLTLQAADLTVSEAGQQRPAQVTRLPDADLDIAIVVNLAGGTADVRATRGAALELLRRLPIASRTTVVATGGSAAPAALTADKSATIDELALLREGSRPLSDAVRQAGGTVLAGGRPRPTVVVVSGAAVADPVGLSGAVAQGPKWRRPALYLATAGSAAVTDPSPFNGGMPVTVARASQLIGATDQINTELSSQYLVSFRSGRSSPNVTVAVARAGVAAQTTVALPAGASPGSGPASARGRPPVPLPRGGSTLPTRTLALVAVALLVAGALLVMVRGRRRPDRSVRPAPAPGPPVAAVPASPADTTAGVAAVGAVATTATPPPRVDDRTTASVRAGDKGLEQLAARLASLPDGFPLDALVVREVVGNATAAGSTLTVAGAFRDLNSLSAEMNGSAWVPLWVEAMWSGFEQARGHGLSAALLAHVGDEVGSASADGGEVQPPEGLAARLAAIDASGRSPALRAALAYQAVASDWPDPESAELLARFSIVFSLAGDGALHQPVLDVSEHLGPPRGGAHDGNAEAAGGRVGSEEAALVPVLDAISAASALAVERVSSLEALRRKWHANSAAERHRARDVVDAILANPIVTVAGLVRQLHMSPSTAEAHIAAFEACRLLRPIGLSSRTPYWVAPAALAIVADDPLAPPRSLAHTTRS